MRYLSTIMLTGLLGAASVIVGVGAGVGGTDTVEPGDGWTE